MSAKENQVCLSYRCARLQSGKGRIRPATPPAADPELETQGGRGSGRGKYEKPKQNHKPNPDPDKSDPVQNWKIRIYALCVVVRDRTPQNIFNAMDVM